MAPTRHAHFSKQNSSQTRQLQAILDPYPYSTSAFLPTETLKVRKIHSYNDLQKLVKPHFYSSSSSSVELAYCPSTTSTLDGFYTKRLLSVACVVLDQQNLCNFTESFITQDFPYLLEAILCTCTCARFIERWGSSARVRGSRRGWGSCEHKQV